MTNRKLLILLGPVAALVMFAGTVKIVSVFVSRSEYKEPYRAPSATVDAAPRAEGLASEKAAAESKARATPSVEAEYRIFPVVGSRVAIWVVAQLRSQPPLASRSQIRARAACIARRVVASV